MQIEGYVTGFGQPSWRETHPPAKATAPAVQARHTFEFPKVTVMAKCPGFVF